MVEYLTKNEYETFVKLQDKFDECLEQCATEIFVTQHKHEPRGEFCVDHELYDKYQYMVQFETHSCGESDFDTVYVPIPYLHDELYRERYGTYLEDRNRRRAGNKEAEIQRSNDARAKEKEIHDQAEYERLKRKYEKTSNLETNK